MNTTKFLQNARRALVPMRKATLDAIPLTVFIVWLLALSGVIYALTLGVALVLRLRRVDRQMKGAVDEEQPLEEGSQELSYVQTMAWVMSYWGRSRAR